MVLEVCSAAEKFVDVTVFSFLVDVESCDIKSLLAGVEDTGVLQSFLNGVSSGFFFSNSSSSSTICFDLEGVDDHDVVVGGDPLLSLSFSLFNDCAVLVVGVLHEVVVGGALLSVFLSFILSLSNGVVVVELGVPV